MYTVRTLSGNPNGVTCPHSGLRNGGVSDSGTPLWPMNVLRLMLCHRLGCAKKGLPGTVSMNMSGLEGV